MNMTVEGYVARIVGPVRGNGDKGRIKRHENLNKRLLGVIANLRACDSFPIFIYISHIPVPILKLGGYSATAT